MIVYAIVKVGWEYNDEYHYRAESDGGEPMVVYKRRKSAEGACLKLNLEKFRSLASSNWEGVASYLEGFDEDLSNDKRQDLEDLGVEWGKHQMELPSNADDKTMTKIISMLGIVFYEIYQVEYEE